MAKLVYPESVDLCRVIAGFPDVSKYLSALKRHSKGSYEHCIRVGQLCIDMIYADRFGQNNIVVIGRSGLLHDLGKKETPLEILEKPDRLTADEMEVMRYHVRQGYIALRGERNEDVRKVIAAHHEFQKNGYPRSGHDRRARERGKPDRRNPDELVCWFAQVLAVADMYDALANRRSYKPALPKPEIEGILREKFTGDPSLVGHVLARA